MADTPMEQLVNAAKAVIDSLKCTCPRTANDTIILSATCPKCDLRCAIDTAGNKSTEAHTMTDTPMPDERLAEIEARANAPAEHFNRLTPAEAERLAVLLEELGESQQIIGKILRHGYESWHPNDPDQTTNRELLEKELGHVFHAIDRMCAADDLREVAIESYESDKVESIKPYLHHQAVEAPRNAR